MINADRARIIISNVSPRIEDGKYPAKATTGEKFIISADIFCDGQDEISAFVQVKKRDTGAWKKIYLAAAGNDRREATLVPGEEGIYQFRISAWIDHFSTWKKALQKKYEAGQHIDIELQIGAKLLESAAEQTTGKNRSQLLEYSRLLNAGDIATAFRTAMDETLAGIMLRLPDKDSMVMYAQVLEVEAERKKAAFSTWYELFPRSASPDPGRSGTFADVKKLLPRLAAMGFDVLYLPPVHPIGEKNRKGKNNSLQAGPGDPGSPWAIGSRLGGHKSIHPELGDLKDFKALIREAKKLGIEIAMDLAFQCAPDHPYIKQHPQWFRWRPDGTVSYAENPPKKYEDIVPIYFDTDDWQNLWMELKSVVDHWIKQGVTIFRVDNPHTKPLAFWAWLIAETRKEKPELIFLAEAFTRPRIMERLAKAGFNQSYTYFTWRNTKEELETYITELTKTDKRYYYRPNFWPNTPDILPPALTEGGENAHIIRLVLAATLSSSYGIYGPVYEFTLTEPMKGKEEYTDNEKYEIKHWDWHHRTRMAEIIMRVNRIRHENPALQSTWDTEFALTNNSRVICYTRRDTDSNNLLVIAVNLDPFHTQAAEITLPLKKLGLPDNQPFLMHDLLSGDHYRWHGKSNSVYLDPYVMPAHILKAELV